MITLFGYRVALPPALQFLSGVPGTFLATVLAWLLIALAVYYLLTYVLRWLTERLPGEVDDIVLGIVRKPLLALTVVFGIAHALAVLPLPYGWSDFVERATNTAVIVIGGYLAWRVLQDVVLYYGDEWARRTESRIDDILMPIVGLIGPLVVVLAAALLILPQWGIDVTSVLLGAGLIGLVLGLALQETLSNVFSGLTLVADAPFRTGDLIMLSDDKICRVEKIGLRATQLYYLDEHCTIYVPNKDLANGILTNITKPSVDLKVAIAIGVGYTSDLERVKQLLVEIALAHPNVLASDIRRKTPLIEARAVADAASAAALRQALARLELEDALNAEVLALETALRALAAALRTAVAEGYHTKTVEELRRAHLDPLARQIEQCAERMRAWIAVPDPWAQDDEWQAQHNLGQDGNRRLAQHWEQLCAAIAHPGLGQESRLSDQALTLARWLREEYKSIVERWKDPRVTFKGFGAASIDLVLDFYIDDIRLEHYERRQRVITEIAQKIVERFRAENIELPFPQMDLWFRNRIPSS
jgi:MscS family membrane protein